MFKKYRINYITRRKEKKLINYYQIIHIYICIVIFFIIIHIFFIHYNFIFLLLM